MLAEGIPPRAIAAVTFTELAASELLSRVREIVADASAGKIVTELRVALPDGLSLAQHDNLLAAVQQGRRFFPNPRQLRPGSTDRGD
jgi:superfamily I DNA/RNA helicase